MRRNKEQVRPPESTDDSRNALDAGDPYLESLTRRHPLDHPATVTRGAAPDPYLVEIARRKREFESAPSTVGEKTNRSDEKRDST